jgi:hypothetical protein
MERRRSEEDTDDRMIRISRCGSGDIDDVVRFIDTYWKPGHALVKCRRLLDWQHRDPDGRGYSFVVARRRDDGVVLGILGYIPTRRFDAALGGDSVIWLTTWKVRDDANVAGLGLLLLQYLTNTERHLAIGALGLNRGTVPIYEALGYHVGEMEHYVRGNAAVEAFELATLNSVIAPPLSDTTPLQARRLISDEEFDALEWVPPDAAVPRKTPEYFRTRYARHPIYAYLVLALHDAGAPAALMAARTAEHRGRRALRIVDFAGPDEVLGRAGPVVQALLEQVDAEYADVYNTGIGCSVFERAGFRRIDPDGPDIVPDHFEPFERRNVRLWFSLKGSRRRAVLFKGDADQDRPNRVPPSCP